MLLIRLNLVITALKRYLTAAVGTNINSISQDVSVLM